MKYVITIPDRLKKYALATYPSVEAYIEAMLINPLMQAHEADELRRRRRPVDLEVKNELQDLRKKIIIKESEEKK